MTELEKIKAQIADLQKQIEELDATHKEWPQVGDSYWIVDGSGDVCMLTYGDWIGDPGAFSQGNAFRTKAEAEAERDARAVVAELRKQPGRKKFVSGEDNSCLFVNINMLCVSTDCWSCTDNGWNSIYFESRESAQAAINAVGADRILKAARWCTMQEC